MCVQGKDGRQEWAMGAQVKIEVPFEVEVVNDAVIAEAEEEAATEEEMGQAKIEEPFEVEVVNHTVIAEEEAAVATGEGEAEQVEKEKEEKGAGEQEEEEEEAEAQEEERLTKEEKGRDEQEVEERVTNGHRVSLTTDHAKMGTVEEEHEDPDLYKVRWDDGTLSDVLFPEDVKRVKKVKLEMGAVGTVVEWVSGGRVRVDFGGKVGRVVVSRVHLDDQSCPTDSPVQVTVRKARLIRIEVAVLILYTGPMFLVSYPPPSAL